MDTELEDMYEAISTPLSDDIAFQVCALLGLDPNKTHKIILDSAPIQATLTIVQVKDSVYEKLKK